MGSKKRIVVLIAALVIAGLAPISVTADPTGRATTLEVEKLLAKLGYWILKADGKPDASTRHSIMAFQKVEGRKRTGTMSAGDLKALRLASRPAPRDPTTSAH